MRLFRYTLFLLPSSVTRFLRLMVPFYSFSFFSEPPDISTSEFTIRRKKSNRKHLFGLKYHPLLCYFLSKLLRTSEYESIFFTGSCPFKLSYLSQTDQNIHLNCCSFPSFGKFSSLNLFNSIYRSRLLSGCLEIASKLL
jgi:hypothetical protein